PTRDSIRPIRATSAAINCSSMARAASGRNGSTEAITCAAIRGRNRGSDRDLPQEGNDMSQEAVNPVNEPLTRWCEGRRQETVNHILSRFRGKLSDADCEVTEKAFSRFQNQLLQGPIRALTEESYAGAASGYTLAEALCKLFRLPD